jgi:hypothetical protein
MPDPTLEFLKAHKLALTRANYLHILFLGNPPASTEEVIFPPEIIRAERQADAKFLLSVGLKPCR